MTFGNKVEIDLKNEMPQLYQRLTEPSVIDLFKQNYVEHSTWERMLLLPFNKLKDHNEKRLKLGLLEVECLPDENEVKRVNEDYTLWQYRVGGDKYNESKEALSRD